MSEYTVSAQDRVLLIDDDELVAVSLREYLVRRGSQVDVAFDLSSSAELMGAREYDVIIVDPYLTGGVAREDDVLLDTIRALQPLAAVIILTAYSSPPLAATAERLHVHALLAKPQSVVFLGQFVSSRCVTASLSSKGQPA